MAFADFDLTALGEAIESQRLERGLTWAGLARQVAEHGPERGPARRRVASSTIRAIGTRPVAEGDGVLQILLWLDRSPESFVPGHPLADSDEARLPRVPTGQILRWDAAKLYAALDDGRSELGLTWAAVASEIGCAPGNLTGLARAQRVTLPFVMRPVGWLGGPAAQFTRASEW